MYDRAINRYRRSLGVGRTRGAALLSWAGAERTVVLVSEHYFGEAPPDWRDSPMVGFSAWAGPAGHRPDEQVDHFLDDGDPPVLVCLGTSAATGAADAFATMAKGLRHRGLRPLLLVGDEANLAGVRDEPGAFTFAPVGSVAGRCAVAVVSGALGTLAACLTAGLPVVVLPQLFDQLWHGRRVEALGVGIIATNAARVPAAVERVLRDPSFRRRARDLGEKLRSEDGAAAVVDAVGSVT